MKLLVELTIPSVGESVDVWIPDFIPIGEVIRMAVRAVSLLTEQRYVPSGSECLCLKKGSRLLHPDCSLADYGVRHGDSLILV